MRLHRALIRKERPTLDLGPSLGVVGSRLNILSVKQSVIVLVRTVPIVETNNNSLRKLPLLPQGNKKEIIV